VGEKDKSTQRANGTTAIAIRHKQLIEQGLQPKTGNTPLDAPPAWTVVKFGKLSENPAPAFCPGRLPLSVDS
jgi:hypothetical protein